MHTMKKVLAALLLLGASPLLAGEEAGLANIAEQVLQPFKADLQAALQAGMARGPLAAIEVCQLEAPELASAAAAPGIRVGRSSHRVRNPDNAPKPWQRALLDDWLARPGTQSARLLALDHDRYGYAEPIITQPLCLACHGSTLSPEISEQLALLYPEDEATGFAAGELRGLFWVELTPAEMGEPWR